MLYTPETNTTLQINYTSIKKKKETILHYSIKGTGAPWRNN